MLPRYYDVLQDVKGNIIAGATVTVKTWQGAAASLYTDRTGGSLLLSNTIESDAKGQVSFFAAPGSYRLEVSKPGYTAVAVDDIILPEVDTSFNASYFGIQEGADDQDITAALQAWVYAIIEHSSGTVESGRVRCGIIDLPYGNFVSDSLIWHPAVSLYGANRGGTKLKLKSAATAVGTDAVRAQFYILARTQDAQPTGAWMPMFKNLRMSGAKGQQANQLAYGIYCERAQNDPEYEDYLVGSTLKGYSAFHGENLEIENCSGDGIRVNTDRNRLLLSSRVRSVNHGISSEGAVVTTGAGVKIVGCDDPAISEGVFGGCTGHALEVSASLGLLMRGTKAYGGPVRSNTALAVHLQNVNGFNLIGNSFGDTVSLFGAEGSADDIGFSLLGNHFKPNADVFDDDGVPAGTADTSCNAFLRVRGYKNASIGMNDYSAANGGNRFEYLATFTDGAVGFIEFSVSSDVAKPWHTTRAIPLDVAGAGSKASVLMSDPALDTHRVSGQFVIDMSASAEPDAAFSFIHAGTKPALLGNRVHRENGNTWIPAKAQIFEQMTEGGTYAISANRHRVNFYYSGSSLVGAYTVTLPTTPDHGHEVTLNFCDGVSVLTLAMGSPGNHELIGPAITHIPPRGTSITLTFKASSETEGEWWVASTRSEGLEPYGMDTRAMTNGGSNTLGAANWHLHLTKASTCTAWTQTLPAAPRDGEKRRLTIHQAVTTWTLSPNTGQTLHTTDTWPTTIPAGGFTIEAQYLSGVWYLTRASA